MGLNAARSVRSTDGKILPYRPTLSFVNKMFILWQTQEQFNLFNVTGLH